MIDQAIASDPRCRAACQVITILQQAEYQAYLVGGCVRDLLLRRTPKDWDVVTSALPDEVEVLFPHCTEVGRSFGVVPVVIEGIPTQVATFRTDGIYEDGRRPADVQLGCTVEQDVQRRDFTVNGMVYDPFHGLVIDPTGLGQQDLKNRYLRAIGNPIDRFQEDKLRMLRAIRFATMLGFKIDPDLAKAIHHLHPEILTVSWERIRDEIKEILLCPQRAKGIQLLDEFGLLPLILPEISALKGVEQPAEFHPEGDVYVHTLHCLDYLGDAHGSASFPQALAMLLHDIGKPATFEQTDRIRFPAHAEVGARMAEAVCQRLKLSADETEEVVWLVANHMKIKDAQKMRRSTLRRFMSEPYFYTLLAVDRADVAASSGSWGRHEFLSQEIARYRDEPLRPTPLVRGQDLLDLEVPPGPIYSQVLRQVEDAQLEGSITSREEALALTLQLLGRD